MPSQSDTKEITIFALGLAVGLAPWFLDKLGYEPPRLVVVGLLLLSVSSVSWSLWQLQWLEAAVPFLARSTTWARSILVFAALVVAFAIVRRELPQQEVVVARPTKLRLQFAAPETFPSTVSSANLYRYYAYTTPYFKLTAYDSAGKPIPTPNDLQAKGWVIYFSFDKPIPAREIHIDSFGATLPHHEVKEITQRYVIVAFDGDITHTAVEIRVEN